VREDRQKVSRKMLRRRRHWPNMDIRVFETWKTFIFFTFEFFRSC